MKLPTQNSPGKMQNATMLNAFCSGTWTVIFPWQLDLTSGAQPFVPFTYWLTDKKEVPGDPSGKQRVLVAVTSEAFGALVCANCCDKWLADFKLRKTNKKAKIPKCDKDDKSPLTSTKTSGQTAGLHLGSDLHICSHYEAKKTIVTHCASTFFVCAQLVFLCKITVRWARCCSPPTKKQSQRMFP